MGDADILAKLSRILETHNLSGGDLEDEGGGGTSIEDILHNISVEAGIRLEDYDDDLNQTRRDDPEYYEKPTPYEVWKARQEEKFVMKKKDTKKLNEQQWDHLVDHLHRSNKMKESALMKEQNQGLALELNGLSFKPAMNPTSLVLASTMKSLKDRLPGMATKKEAALAKRRVEVKHKEMEECTFAPNREGAKTSEKYLSRMGRSTATPEDFFHYHKEKLRRNDQRKKIIDEIESRELTFQPQLNPKSKKIQEKLVQQQTIVVDPVSRQTTVVQRRYADSETEATSTAPPSVAVPEITPRARSYRARGAEHQDVHSRLYEGAVEQIVRAQNKQVDLLQNKLKLSLRPWEATPMSRNQKQYSWTENKTHLAKAKRGGEELIDDANKPVAVLEFDDAYGSLWKDLRTAQISEEFLQRDLEMDEEGRGHAAEL